MLHWGEKAILSFFPSHVHKYYMRWYNLHRSIVTRHHQARSKTSLNPCPKINMTKHQHYKLSFSLTIFKLLYIFFYTSYIICTNVSPTEGNHHLNTAFPNATLLTMCHASSSVVLITDTAQQHYEVPTDDCPPRNVTRKRERTRRQHYSNVDLQRRQDDTPRQVSTPKLETHVVLIFCLSRNQVQTTNSVAVQNIPTVNKTEKTTNPNNTERMTYLRGRRHCTPRPVSLCRWQPTAQGEKIPKHKSYQYDCRAAYKETTPYLRRNQNSKQQHSANSKHKKTPKPATTGEPKADREVHQPAPHEPHPSRVYRMSRKRLVKPRRRAHLQPENDKRFTTENGKDKGGPLSMLHAHAGPHRNGTNQQLNKTAASAKDPRLGNLPTNNQDKKNSKPKIQGILQRIRTSSCWTTQMCDNDTPAYPLNLIVFYQYMSGTPDDTS